MSLSWSQKSVVFRRGVTVAAVSVAALVAAGCSGGSSTATAKSDDQLRFTSPLAELLAATPVARNPDAAQEAVASCMRKRGWEYTPVQQGSISAADFDPLGSDNNLFDAAYREKWGYAVSTVYGDDGKLKPDAPQSRDATTTAASDPNATYVDGLSASERAAYYKDLLGVDPSVAVAGASGNSSDPNGNGGGSDLDTGTATAGGSTAGVSDALAASCGGKALGAGAGLDRLGAALDKLTSAMSRYGLDSPDSLTAKYPELQQAQSDWSACMRKKGFNAATVDEPPNIIDQEFNALGGGGGITDPGLTPATSGGDAPADDANPTPDVAPATTAAAGGDQRPGTGQSDSSAGGSGLDDIGGGFNPATMDLKKFAALQTREVKMAAADHDCQASTYRPVYVKVRMAAEKKLMADNASVVAELRKIMSSNGG